MRSVYFCLLELSPSAVSVGPFGYQITNETNPCGETRQIMARVSVHIAGYNTSSASCLIFALIAHLTYDFPHLFNLRLYDICSQKT